MRTGRLQYEAQIASGVDFAAGDLETSAGPGRLRYIRTTDIRSQTELSATGVFVSENQVPVTARVAAGDLLFTRAGPVGTSYLHVGPEAAFAGYLVRCRVKPRHDPRYFAYWAQSRPFWDQVAVGAVRSTIDNFSGSKYAAMAVPLPEPEVQRRIADYLDTQARRIDRLIELNHRAGSLAWDRFRGSRQHLLVGDRLLGDPAAVNDICQRGWDVMPLWMVCRNLDGRRIPLNSEERGQRPGPYPYWGANAVQGYIDQWLFEGPHVLIGEDGAPYFDERRDVAWVADGKFWVNNHAHVLEPTLVPADWLAECLNVVDYSQYVVGSTRDKLTQAALNSIPIPVPPAEDREQILAQLGTHREVAKALEQSVEANVALLTERRAALVTAAVTGELEV